MIILKFVDFSNSLYASKKHIFSDSGQEASRWSTLHAGDKKNPSKSGIRPGIET